MPSFVSMAAAQIPGLFDAGQTPATSAGSTGVAAAPKLEWIKPSLAGLPQHDAVQRWL